MKRGTLHKMMHKLWSLWTATEVKIGCLFSVGWLCFKWYLWTETEVKIGCLFSVGWLCFNQLVGGVDEQINALVVLVACDILTGLLASFKLHAFASSIATHGLYKKAAMFLIIGLGVLLDSAMNTHMVRTLFIGAFAIVEVLSIVENIDRVGYGQYIPSFIRGTLAQIAHEKKVDKLDDQ